MANLPVTLTYDAAITHLTRAVVEKGADYTYEPPGDLEAGECAYFDGAGNPSCIIGHILHYKGVTVEDIGALNEGMSVDNLVGPNGILLCDEATLRLLGYVQNQQDIGITWGESVTKAQRLGETVS